MRKLTLAIAGLVALVATSVAVAHGIEGAKTATSVAGTFTASASSVSTRTCTTTAGKTIVVTDGKYSGTASGDADLTGAITLRARSVVNTTDGVGAVTGDLRIGDRTHGAFSAVYDHGTIAGLAVGRAQGGGLLANVSAAFSPATGFTVGKVGGGTAGGGAIEFAPGGCNSQGDSHDQSRAEGTISALSASSITVAGLTCAIPSDKSADVNAKFKTGDSARIQCALQNGTNTLTRIDARH